MRKILFFTICALLSLSYSSFADVLGPPSACLGNNIWYADGSDVAGGTWSSSNLAVCTINVTTGVATALSTGTATIVYTSTAGASSTVLTVTPWPSVITGTPTTFCAGVSVSFSDSVAGGTWSSDNINIATVDTTTGIVTGVSDGNTRINYNMGGCGTSMGVTVNATVPDTPAGPSCICPGSVNTFTEIATGGTWSSSDPAVATVSSTGVITAVGVGTVNITYTIPIPTGTCGPGYSYRTITVSTTTVPGSINAAGPFAIGVPYTFSAEISGGVWSTSNAAIATVDAHGTITPVSAGTCILSYAVTGCSGIAYATTTIFVSPRLTAGSINTAPGNISLFPNPTTGHINISYNAAHTEEGIAVITDITGRTVYSAAINIAQGNGTASIDLSTLKTGIYMISIKSASVNYKNKIQLQK